MTLFRPHADLLVDVCKSLLKQNSDENVIELIRCMTGVMKKDFLKYYAAFMPGLKQAFVD